MFFKYYRHICKPRLPTSHNGVRSTQCAPPAIGLCGFFSDQHPSTVQPQVLCQPHRALSTMFLSLILMLIIGTISAVSGNRLRDSEDLLIRRTRQQPTCRVTGSDIEGPFYKRNAPIQRVSPAVIAKVCSNSVANDRLILNGTIRQVVKGFPCGKSTRAILDIWHANANGDYSDRSATSKDFSCRTRLLTNDDGTFTFSTIFPGRYDDGGFRPAHVHFQITPLDQSDAATGKTLTTQLYFAQDHFLSPRDSCSICASADPTLITHVSHENDIKTFTGTWDVLLAGNR